jgi:ribose/xylose/arabinose/galactoside ABC-type transport system permease subunit
MIAAVVIGGLASWRVGTIRGTILVFFSCRCQQRSGSANVSSYYQETVQGLILVIAVLLNRWKSD